MLFRREKWVELRNTGAEAVTVRDGQLPGGSQTFAPGEVSSLPRDVWNRARRRHEAVLKRTEGLAETEPESTCLRRERERLSGLKYPELRELARERSIIVPFGTSKERLIDRLLGAEDQK